LREDGDDYRHTSFLSILLYVIGFMVVLAALAFVAAWLLHR
jgi:preprotein translocase subunit SecE